MLSGVWTRVFPFATSADMCANMTQKAHEPQEAILPRVKTRVTTRPKGLVIT